VTVWSDESAVKVAELWAEGHSASMVAKLMNEGRTRCAIIGKVHRLGLSKRKEPTDPAKRKSYPKSRTAGYSSRGLRSVAPAKPLPVFAPRDVTGAKPWDAIVEGECARPVGEPARPAEQLVCANPTGTTGRDWQYCPACKREMFTKAYGSFTEAQITKTAMWAARRFG
jgi:hypothetical protein